MEPWNDPESARWEAALTESILLERIRILRSEYAEAKVRLECSRTKAVPEISQAKRMILDELDCKMGWERQKQVGMITRSTYSFW
jgi:hypothetical protein